MKEMATKKLLENLILALRLYVEDFEQNIMFTSITLDDLAKAISDLKANDKEMPTKPELISDGDYDGEPVYDMWKCPNCGKLYEIDYDVYDYCPNCGQHIDS